MDRTYPLEASVVIISFNTRDLLKECLTALYKESEGINFETIVVDNASRDNSAEMVENDFPQVKLIKSSSNLGFAAANNEGFRHANGRYVVLLNSDAFMKPDTFRKALLKMNEDQTVGLAGCRLVGEDNSWQPSARQFPSLINDFLHLSGLAARYPASPYFGRADRTWADPMEPAEVDWVPGAFAIIRHSVLDQIGDFDERFFLYYEEVDLCRRIKEAGYKICYWPDLVVIHLGGASSKTVKQLTLSSAGSQLTLWRMRSALLYFRKQHGFLTCWAMKNLEIWWHRLRAIKNEFSLNPVNHAKAEESLALVALMKQAWKETQGGKVSPPRPW